MSCEFLLMACCKVLFLKVVKFFHSSSAEKEVKFVFILVLCWVVAGNIKISVGMIGINLTEGVSSSDVGVIWVIFGVGFIFHGPFVVKGDIFEVDVGENSILLIHDLDLFVALTVF